MTPTSFGVRARGAPGKPGGRGGGGAVARDRCLRDASGGRARAESSDIERLPPLPATHTPLRVARAACGNVSSADRTPLELDAWPSIIHAWLLSPARRL